MILLWLILAGLATSIPGAFSPTNTGSNFGKPSKYELIIWTAPKWEARTRSETCNIQLFALSSHMRRVRLVLDGKEQLLDWSWTETRIVKVNEDLKVKAEFIDPVSRKSLSVQEVTVPCKDVKWEPPWMM